MGFKVMSNGSIAYGPSEILDMFNKTIINQMQLDATSKFQPNTKVKIIASLEELTKYYESTGETRMQAKNHAFIILGNKEGIIIGATKCTEGMFYSVEFDTEPMAFLPEKFLSK